MNASLFPLLAPILSALLSGPPVDPSGPCVRIWPDCESGATTVVLDVYVVPPPWTLWDYPVEWHAFAVCPPPVVWFCPATNPPFWVGWQTYAANGSLLDSGRRFFP